jgi:hypothetical protein
MSQAGFTPIQLYFSTTAAAAPSAGNLANGELAINITDGKLFYKDNSGSVQVLATKAGASGDVVGPASSTDNALARFDSTTGKLVQNSVGILSDTGDLTGIAAITMSGALTLSGNIAFTGTGNRITGDFSNATTANRVAFQSSTVNGSTALGVIPNGTGGTGQINLFSSSDPGNSSVLSLLTAAALVESRLQSGITGTGTYLPMTFFTGGSERLRIDTSGNVGVGTSSPSSRFAVVDPVGSATSISFLGSPDGLTTNWRHQLDNDGFNGRLRIRDSSNTETIRLSSSGDSYLNGGNVGIGTASPGSALHVARASGTATYLQLAQTSVESWQVGMAASSSALAFLNSGSERMRIDTAGNVGIGTSSPNASAILDAQSTTKGVRMPNMTTTQKNAIASPAAGLVVFDTTLAKLCVYTTAWETITSI